MTATEPRPRSLLVAAVLLALSAPAWGQTAEDPMGYSRGSAYLSMSWESASGEPGPKGLLLIDIAPAGHVSRWLVADPEREWRLILTESLDPRLGLATTELLDDVTGWWIRLETRHEIEGETLGAFFLRSHDLPSIDEATGDLDFRLSTRSGLDFAPRIPARGATTSAIWDGFFAQLTADDTARHLAASVPEGFRAPVLFLDVSLMDWSSAMSPGAAADRPRTWPGLLGLLARVLRASLPSDDPRLAEFAVPWTMRRMGPVGKGSSIVEPELLELASHFRSVENADPMAGHRVDDLAARAADF